MNLISLYAMITNTLFYNLQGAVFVEVNGSNSKASVDEKTFILKSEPIPIPKNNLKG